MNRSNWLLLLMLSTGCATSGPMLYTKQDAIKQERVTGVAGNQLQAGESSDGKQAKVFLSPQRILREDGTQHFQFVVQISRPQGPFFLVKPGHSLFLDIDGNRVVYATRQGSGPRRVKLKKLLGTTYSESAVYEDISESDIARISKATSVLVSIDGKNQHISSEFSEQNFAAFEALLERISLSSSQVESMADRSPSSSAGLPN